MKLFEKEIFGTTRYIAFFTILFFVCFCIYIWLFGDTRLIYHVFGESLGYPAFFTSWKFLVNTIDHPGGIVEYVTGFLSQFYYYPLAGAIVITIVVWLTCLATAVLVKIAGLNYLAGVAGYTPAICFLAMHNKCDHPLAVFVALLINLWFLFAYEKMRPRSFASRSCLFSVMFTILYYIAGGAALLFGILAASYEILARRRLLLGGLYVLLTGLLPWIVGTWYFDIRLTDIYLHLLPFNPKMVLITKTTAQVLYVSIPCIVLSKYIRQSFFSVKTSKQIPADTEKKQLRWLIQPIVVVLAAIGTVFLSAGSIEKKLLQVNFYSSSRMWPHVLEYVNRFPVVSRNPVTSHDIIQALYQTDRLGSDMFSYTQFGEALFLPPKKGCKIRSNTRSAKSIRLYLQLGRVNVAEKEAYEMLEKAGDHPETLWHLAIINIAKCQPETARVFLEVLSRDLIHGKKAKRMLKRLDKDPQLNNDEEIMRIRSVMCREDAIALNYSAVNLLSDLLESNPHNKMAFEYLMACYLMKKQVGKVAENISRFRSFGYEKIPRHYEEAILIHQGTTREKIDLHGWQINPETIEKSNQFMLNLNLNRGDKLAAARALAPDFGNTYFFYFVFEKSGLGR